VSPPTELASAEDLAYRAFCDLGRALTDDEWILPGYQDDWSAKDLLAHIGAWQVEAGWVLEQIANGTHRAGPVDVDELNRRFLEANRDLPLEVVRAEAAAARNRMLRAWADLGSLPGGREAEEWFVESGVQHYGEHSARLREWVEELLARRSPAPGPGTSRP
jgi:hypothetical protein